MNTLMRLKEEQERIAALIEEEQKKFNPEDLTAETFAFPEK